MAGSRRATRSPDKDHEKVRSAWRLVACLPLVLLVVGLGVRAGLEADWNDDTQPAAAASDNRKVGNRDGNRDGERKVDAANAQRVGTTNTIRRTFAGDRKLTPREARARCEKAGIDPADLGSMSECIADLTT